MDCLLTQLWEQNFKPDRLQILDPNNENNDISLGSHKVKTIFEAFAVAFRQLRSRMAELDGMTIEERKGQSLLGAVLAGNYQSFGYQRDHMRKIFELR